MSIIKRYAVWESLHEDCNGQLVAFADHEREIAALKAQLEVYTGQVTAKHGMNCFATLAEGNLCTCGYIYKVMVRGEQALRVDAQNKLAEATRRIKDLEPFTGFFPDMLTALLAYEALDNQHANCENCEGEVQPELCEKCFPFADRARLQMRAVLKKVRGQ
jgi:hypothetical protein